jgi:general secretion pathway protein A
MYIPFFKLNQAPFSIAPDPRYLFMSERHREALAHLLYGVNSGGGFVLLTGEIGAGKTTVCRCLLEQIPTNCNVAYIFNPKLTVNELLQSIGQEFRIPVAHEGPGAASLKEYVDSLNQYLLATHADGKSNVLIIDEAQNLSADVLEQLRLLTNLETNERKLLQIILIGQPELRAMLARPELEQLAQRVIARYHLDSLSEQETARYIQHRLGIAGLNAASPFRQKVTRLIYKITNGVPRRINLLCDRALLGAYVEGKSEVDRSIVKKAATEIFGTNPSFPRAGAPPWRMAVAALALGVLVVGAIGLMINRDLQPKSASVTTTTLPGRFAGAGANMPNPAATLTLADLNGAAGNGALDEKAAYRQLASLWNVNLADGEPCEAALKEGLQCYKSDAGLAEIRLLDRPVILVLQDASGKDYHALLSGLTNVSASLRIGEANRIVSLAMLAGHFKGNFFSFWRARKPFRENIFAGYRGADVDWLATQLAKLNGIQPPPANQILDANMVGLLRKFQAAQGLKADGMAGPRTFMILNAIAGVDEPRLSTAAPPANPGPNNSPRK